MNFKIIFLGTLILLTFSSCGYKWEKKRYSLEKQLDKLEKQSNQNIDVIMNEFKK